MKRIIIFLLPLLMWGCYEDKGNYEYRDINEIEVTGVENHYERDLDESLKITPSLEGTLYSDPSRFTYKWTIDGNTVSEELGLDIIINLTPGLRKGKFIITDKETEVVTYTNFDLNVSSVTAGDLFMVLSKAKGKAELSYLRLDKEGANFTVNFFEERFGQSLGTNPKQLDVIYMEYRVNDAAVSPYIYPFGRNYGGVMALVDNQLKLLDKNSLEPDPVALSGASYLGGTVYPVPDTSGYLSQYTTNHVSMWRDLANGAHQTGFQFYEISDGKAYGYTVGGNYIAGAYRWAAASSIYASGYLAPFCFIERASADTAEGDNIAAQHGYTLGNAIVYDVVNCRFASLSGYGGLTEIPLEAVPAFPGFNLMYGSYTNEASTFYAILWNGSAARMVVMRKSGSTYSLIKNVDVSAVVNENSKFYTMAHNDYLFIVTGDKIYSYNRLNAEAGSAPSTAPVITLADCGYDGTARITAMTVSRSEQTMLLGVSRYGADAEAMSEELKGDLVQLKMNAASVTLTYDKKYEGVAGIPADVKIKYQTHLRDGRAFMRGGTGEIIDKI